MPNSSFSVVDIEVTEEKEIFQIAIINLDNKLKIKEKFNYFVKASGELSSFLISLTGITNEMLVDQPNFSEVASEIHSKIKDNILVCHGVMQDSNILIANFEQVGIQYHPKKMLDTVELTKIYFPTLKSYRLVDIARELSIVEQGYYHQADVDALVTVELLIKIVEKINNVAEENYNELRRYLTEHYSEIYEFSDSVRKCNFQYGELYMKKYNLIFANKNYNIASYKKSADSKNLIFIVSVPEEEFIEKILDGNFPNITILKDYKNYLPLDFQNIFFSKIVDIENKSVATLYIKILIWIQDAKVGDLAELNLDLSEQQVLELIISNVNVKNDNYYYNNALAKSLASGYMVSSYNSLPTLLANNKLSDYTFIFEDRQIFGSQIKKIFVNTLYYKNVVTELNININNKRNKKLQIIQDNIDYIVTYLHDMYLLEETGLYNETNEFIKQDLEFLIEDIKNVKPNLFKASIFINTLYNILINKNYGYYKFEILNVANSMMLKYTDLKKEKLLVNKINEFKTGYLRDVVAKKPINLKLKYCQKIPSDIFKEYSKKRLIIFESQKEKELYYSERDKKSSIKFRNYAIDNSFMDLYSDINKMDRNGYLCYADKDILKYKLYLEDMFDEILVFNGDVLG